MRSVLASSFLLFPLLLHGRQGYAVSREDTKLGTIVGIVPKDSTTASARLMTTYAAKDAFKHATYLNFVVIIEDLAFDGDKAVVSNTSSSRIPLAESRVLLKMVREMLTLADRKDRSSHRDLEWANGSGFAARYIESEHGSRFEFAVDGQSKKMWLKTDGARKFEDQLARGVVWLTKRQR